ncbi:holo-ACP synthase [Clostridium estertheticum]|uniref:Holo-[acyl-carrier-protein] synthase n=2 Tax=Clostridium estertheticum TaxID=238834 RepID=A0A1J0GMQ5_9CLOT|nr:holo-ACP synthase [Clostridium estertheticum]APC42182.1 holo-ACP synthase [Clostridium estertheticum subsp. estertheticum]MBU3073732.1 holo-ACP synthase [Clostridium estertheticum]MBU3163825.1 holo-ACP synthase [Clostridium estertheticum]MBU3172356.1 holo-ACP synthase [Clostridium estertheticum]MBU3184203.1 holo-ACP synthase [Clostridium estertheticum]
MILGVGTDIVEIRRIKHAMESNNKFLEKIFTSTELEYLKSRNLRAEYVAGRFAAKEAVAKALGTGFMGFDFKDIEVDRTTLGKPVVILKGKAKLIAKKEGQYIIHLSISHGEESAIAYAILEVEKKNEEVVEIAKLSDPL